MSTLDVSLNKLIGRLDVVSKGIQNLSSKFNNFKLNATTFGIDELNINPKEKEETTGASINNVINQIELPDYSLDIAIEWNNEYNETFQKIENRAREFAIQIEGILDNVNELSANISIDKLFGIEADISGLAVGILNIFTQAIHAIDWSEIGSYIGRFLNAINWDRIFSPLSETIWKAFNSVLESFKGIITTVSTEITVNYSVKTSESSNKDWLSKISEKLFDKLLSGELFKKFKNVEIILSGGLIKDDDFFSKLANSFALASGGAGTLSESLAAVFGKSGGIASIVAGAFLGVANFVDMLKNGFSWMSELMMLVGTALAAVGAVILGVSVGTAALVAGIVAGVATVVILVKDNWDTICAWFSGLGEWFDENVITPVVEFFKGLWESVRSFFSSLLNDIYQIWGNLPEWFNEYVIIPVVTFFEGLWEAVSALFTTLWQSVSEIWGIVSEWFNENVITPIVTFFGELWENINGLFTSLWENICEIWGIVSDWFKENVITPVVSFFEGFFMRVRQVFERLWIIVQAIWILASAWFNENVITPVISLFEGIWTNVSGFFEGLWNDIKTIWQGVATWFDENVIQPIQNFFGSMWDGIKQGMISTMNAVIGGIEKGINFIIDGINSIIGGFNRIVSWAAEVAEVEWGGVTPIDRVEMNRIKTFENGGYPENASLFWANEYGVPELVGTVGNRTAVASGTEITGIADAVYSTGQAETSLLTAVVNLLQEIASKDMAINIGDREIARANYRGQKSLGTRLITEF